MRSFPGSAIGVSVAAIALLAGMTVAGLLHYGTGVLAAERHAVVRTPVIVELFTSEGCSSCPPADALLARLQRDQPVPTAGVIALEEHVDYWDNLGWRDRFSSAAITARQSAYERRFRLEDNYTPQMIVDGDAQFSGNDASKALASITRAAQRRKSALSFQSVMVNGNIVAGQLLLPSSIASGGELYVALVQPSASTEVLHGENGGHTLSHVSVVRALERVSSHGNSADFSLTIPKDLPPVGLTVVGFLQRPNQGSIVAATATQLPCLPAASVVKKP